MFTFRSRASFSVFVAVGLLLVSKHALAQVWYQYPGDYCLADQSYHLSGVSYDHAAFSYIDATTTQNNPLVCPIIKTTSGLGINTDAITSVAVDVYLASSTGVKCEVRIYDSNVP